MPSERTPWPALSSPAWPDTCATLHMWVQIAGKIRLKLAPPVNHWWGAALQLSSRGLTTRPMPYDDGTFEMTFDFCAHELRIHRSDGRSAVVALAPKTVADFYAEAMAALAGLGITVRIWPMPVEVPSPVRFTEDRTHASYDAAAAGAWWRATASSAAVMNEFRASFIGKSSPVHFWWGSFDLAVTRFSGRRAPERPGADAVTREAYSHEVISAGFWPGGGAMPQAAYYAYAAPEPAGFTTARVRPDGAFYSPDFGEYLLTYEQVRTAASPRAALLEFLQTTYEAGATLGGWNRKELER